MFSLLRLFGRKEHIDDAAAAYIEGRATERERAELDSRAAKDPSLFDDLDSIRQTVSLLRSIEPAQAPLSFALAEAPVQVRVKHTRLAMAPAVFAIAAAAAVGLLAVGNLADVVRQSDGTSSVQTRGTSNDAATGLNLGQQMDTAAAGLPGEPGPAGDPGEQGPDGPQGGAGPDGGSSSSAQTEIAALPMGTPEPESASAPAQGGTRLAPPSIDSDPADTTADSEFSTQRHEGSIPLEPALPAEVPGGDAGSAPEMAGASGPVTELEDADAAKLTEDLPTPLPNATATGLFDQSLALRSDTADQPGTPASLEEDPAGFALPLWQLQVAFASFAVLMAGAWMLLHRRLTA